MRSNSSLQSSTSSSDSDSNDDDLPASGARDAAGQSSPVDEGLFLAGETVVDDGLTLWLESVRQQDDDARRRRLLAHLDDLEAELEAINVSYPISDPLFEWFGTDGYDENGFLT